MRGRPSLRPSRRRAPAAGPHAPSPRMNRRMLVSSASARMPAPARSSPGAAPSALYLPCAASVETRAPAGADSKRSGSPFDAAARSARRAVPTSERARWTLEQRWRTGVVPVPRLAKPRENELRGPGACFEGGHDRIMHNIPVAHTSLSEGPCLEHVAVQAEEVTRRALPGLAGPRPRLLTLPRRGGRARSRPASGSLPRRTRSDRMSR